MADNVTTQTTDLATVPTGTVIATDKIGGIDYQRVKIVWGADGSVADASASDPLPVTLTSTTITGTVAATQSGTWNVGTVSTITNVVHVDDNSGSLTVDAPVATPVFVRLSDGSSAIATLPVSIADGSSVTLGAKADAKSTATDTTAVTAMSVWKQISASVQAIATSVAATLATKIAYQTTKALTNASISASSSGENTLVSGTAAQTIRVFKIALVAAAPVSVSFKDAASGTSLTGAMPLTANGAMVLESNDGEPLFVSATAGAFILNLSAAVTVTGFIQYIKS